ncbi:hypothetical protein F5141DRAFT_1059223 [Pisolithus sp. B1]|nr:hypothetical protein F5141DRAFT_1059223 [Pisolithus sp. B1]
MLLMGYYNPILAYERDKAVPDAHAAGANRYIIGTPQNTHATSLRWELLGHPSRFSGWYVLEALFDYLIELEGAYNTMQNDLTFWAKFTSHYGYMNCPSKLYFAESLTKYANSALVWLRREDLTIGPPHPSQRPSRQCSWPVHPEGLGTLPEDMACFHVAEIISALAHFHKHQIMHCNLKLDNNLLDFTGHAHLTNINITVHAWGAQEDSNLSGVFHVCNVHTNKEFTAKFLLANDTDSILQHEYEVISKLQGIAGIPCVTLFGKEASHSVMVFEHLGPSLEEVFHSCHQSFSHHTIAAISEQLNIHLCIYIHWDVKPSNILIGTGQDASAIYLVDFSIAKPYQDPHMHLHNTFSKCGGFLGSPAFASVNGHLGFEAGSSLPWLGHMPCLENDAIVNMKRDIFQHGNIPKFPQKPDYVYLQALMKSLCTDPLCDSCPEWLHSNGMLSMSIIMNDALALGCRREKPVVGKRPAMGHQSSTYIIAWLGLQAGWSLSCGNTTWVCNLTGSFKNDISYILSTNGDFIEMVLVPWEVPYHSTPQNQFCGHTLFDINLTRAHGLEVTVSTDEEGHPIATHAGNEYHCGCTCLFSHKNQIKMVNGDTGRICSGEYAGKLACVVMMDSKSSDEVVKDLEISIHNFKLEFLLVISVKVIVGMLKVPGIFLASHISPTTYTSKDPHDQLLYDPLANENCIQLGDSKGTDNPRDKGKSKAQECEIFGGDSDTNEDSDLVQVSVSMDNAIILPLPTLQFSKERGYDMSISNHV